MCEPQAVAKLLPKSFYTCDNLEFEFEDVGREKEETDRLSE